MKSLWAAVAALLLVTAGCASTPQASAERDADAKRFYTHPNAGTIYVYRSQFNRFEQLDDDSTLYVDDRLIGNTIPGTYFRVDVVPGRHMLHGVGRDSGRLSVDVRPGELYFVRLDVMGGNSVFRLEPDRVGRAQIQACCALLENWAPGQRPFLR